MPLDIEHLRSWIGREEHCTDQTPWSLCRR